MAFAILFWTMVAASCGYAIVFGAWEGRVTTAIIISASVGTAYANKWLDFHWYSTNTGVFIVDLATLTAMYLVAARSRRWWPLWVAAFQLNSVAAHLATMISPEFSAQVYHGMESLWALPGQLVMVLGIFRDRIGKFRYEFA
jgi:hypothetical protein